MVFKVAVEAMFGLDRKEEILRRLYEAEALERDKVLKIVLKDLLKNGQRRSNLYLINHTVKAKCQKNRKWLILHPC